MLRVCQSIRTSSLPDKENQAIFAARSPTAIRNIRPLSLRPKQIPETSRSGTWTTRRTRSRFLFDLRFLPSERVSAGMKGTLQPSLDDFSGFCSTKDRFSPRADPPARVPSVKFIHQQIVGEDGEKREFSPQPLAGTDFPVPRKRAGYRIP